ncbi:MAG: hypothetical protein WA906_10200 [Pacificimonas sp.]
MNWLQRLLVPSFIASPIWLWLTSGVLRGPAALTEYSFSFVDLSFAVSLTLLGLILFGLPLAAWVSTKAWSAAMSVGFLILVGACAGPVVAILCVVLLSGGHILSTDESFFGLPTIAMLGMGPGLIVAIVWCGLNFSDLRKGSSGA